MKRNSLMLKTVVLGPGENILAVVPNTNIGLGYYTQTVRVIIETKNGQIRNCYLYPDDWTYEMSVLFKIGEQVCEQLKCAVPTKRRK